ncbi:MAG: hypothetical protein FWC39_07530 [Bacteroidetes bacterium]|nr:hypothetical protein [Bacteroidota bacterium]
MQVLVNVLDSSRAVFIMELLHSFSYVKVQPVASEKTLFARENNDIVAINVPLKKQIKRNIAISPFVMSMVAENPIPADYDYKSDYKSHLSKKYV